VCKRAVGDPASFESAAVVYPACVGRKRSSLANMDSRAPRANRGAGVKRQGCYRPEAVSVEPKGHGSRHSLSISGESGEQSLRRQGHGVRDILLPDGPDEAAEFVGHRYGRLVVAAAVAERESPVMQSAQRLRGKALALGRDEHRAGPVGEQTAEINIAPLSSMAARMLARGQTEPTRKLPRLFLPRSPFSLPRLKFTPPAGSLWLGHRPFRSPDPTRVHPYARGPAA
jgi:hypothetical protein